ncbi:hypothetical protein CRG98_033767 [Punica granatum]|uniref:Uncharacterized protein n=1 Tax=Punica granatum TaxID=22663 RepID=A0A2I0IQY3_PUNGR|nr:hypothetical protein CRG98_033767 [Punica granatum]
MCVKLGRIDGLPKKKEGEALKNQTVATSKKGKATSVNFGRQTSQPISVDYTSASPTYQTYAHLVHYVQPYQSQQAYPSAPPTVIYLSSPLKHSKTKLRLRDLLSRLNVLQLQELNKAVLLNCVYASNTPIFQLLHPTYSGNSS